MSCDFDLVIVYESFDSDCYKYKGEELVVEFDEGMNFYCFMWGE